MNFSKVILMLFTIIFFSFAQTAAAAEEGWQVRIVGAWVDPDLSETIEDVGISSDSSIGFGLSLERRITDRIGVELGGLWAKPDVDLSVRSPSGEQLVISDGLSFVPIYLGFNLHLIQDKPVDFYFGPMLTYVCYGLTFDNDWAWGLNVGADVGLGNGSWSLSAAVKYLDTDLTFGDGGSVSLAYDPIIVSVGFGVRF